MFLIFVLKILSFLIFLYVAILSKVIKYRTQDKHEC